MEWFNAAKTAIHKTYTETYSSLTSPLKVSEFLEKGVLTPEEVGGHIAFKKQICIFSTTLFCFWRAVRGTPTSQ